MHHAPRFFFVRTANCIVRNACLKIGCVSAVKQLGPESAPGSARSWNWGTPRLIRFTDDFERQWVVNNKFRLACFMNLVRSDGCS